MSHDLTQSTSRPGQWSRAEGGALTWTHALPRDVDRGTYLCEGCFDCMTDDVLPAALSPTGVDMAWCPRCAAGDAAKDEP
jgi:hypothetical protein